MERSPHILVVDDDQDIRTLVCRYLRDHNMRADAASGAVQARQLLATGAFDLAVLDIMMPGVNGMQLCRELQHSHPDLALMFLTAVDEEADRVMGLETGADDYITKPFSPRELLARIRVVLRRRERPLSQQPANPGETLGFAGWTLRPGERSLRAPDGALVSLTSGEFDLLLAFARHPHQVLNRDQLLDLTRGREATAYDRAVDVQLSRLRRKLEPDVQEPQLIRTVRGAGYLLAADVSHSEQPNAGTS